MWQENMNIIKSILIVSILQLYRARFVMGGEEEKKIIFSSSPQQRVLQQWWL